MDPEGPEIVVDLAMVKDSCSIRSWKPNNFGCGLK